MKLYIFENVEGLIDGCYHYHGEGGLVVAAECPHAVLDLLKHRPAIKLTIGDFDRATVYDVQDDVKPKVYVFPDEACA